MLKPEKALQVASDLPVWHVSWRNCETSLA